MAQPTDGLLDSFGKISKKAATKPAHIRGVENHRGIMFLMSSLTFLTYGRIEINSFNVPDVTDRVERWKKFELLQHYSEASKPSFFSYKSDCNNRFDSVVFVNPFLCLGIPPNFPHLPRPIAEKEKRQWAAILAHRTMRMRGTSYE